MIAVDRGSARHDILIAALLFGLALALAAAARFLLVEPTELAHRCVDAPGTGICTLRRVIVRLFRFQEPGWAAAVTGALALFCAPRGGPVLVAGAIRTRIAAAAGYAALVFGAIGLMLYSFDPAAVGLLLGVIALTRLTVARRGATTSR
ncbi:MAG: hypothetical protein ABWZ78_15000 [Burkholderiaceae bacterium]|jgi:hypothetical protein